MCIKCSKNINTMYEHYTLSVKILCESILLVEVPDNY